MHQIVETLSNNIEENIPSIILKWTLFVGVVVGGKIS